MHRRMPKKMVGIAIAFAVALPSLTAGCAGEELVGLTESGLEELPKERSDQENQAGQEEHAGCGSQDGEGTSEESGGNLKGDTESGRNPGVVYVHVCGEVASPGVYSLPEGSRLYEAIEAAGGILESGAGEQLNQAAQIGDGQQVYVPSREEVRQGFAVGGNSEQESTAAGQTSPVDDGKVNLNTASKEQLMTLSGIGEAKAASIIAYREEHGGFRKAEELMEVEGIKEGVFNKVKDQIRID